MYQRDHSGSNVSVAGSVSCLECCRDFFSSLGHVIRSIFGIRHRRPPAIPYSQSQASRVGEGRDSVNYLVLLHYLLSQQPSPLPECWISHDMSVSTEMRPCWVSISNCCESLPSLLPWLVRLNVNGVQTRILERCRQIYIG